MENSSNSHVTNESGTVNTNPELTPHLNTVSTSEPSADNCCVIDISDDEIYIESPVKRKRTRRQVTEDAELIDLTSASPGTSDDLKKSRTVEVVIRSPPQLPPPPVGPRCPVCLEPFENVSVPFASTLASD